MSATLNVSPLAEEKNRRSRCSCNLAAPCNQSSENPACPTRAMCTELVAIRSVRAWSRQRLLLRTLQSERLIRQAHAPGRRRTPSSQDLLLPSLELEPPFT